MFAFVIPNLIVAILLKCLILLIHLSLLQLLMLIKCTLLSLSLERKGNLFFHM